MKILNWYIARDLLFNTLVATGVLTFVMLSGNLFKAFQLLFNGVPPLIFGRFLLYLIPEMLRYTLPLSLLTSTVLLFSRLSADNEITALKASGISLWQLISPGLALATVISIVCLWLAVDLAPRCRRAADLLRRNALSGVQNPLALIEPERFVNLGGGFSIRAGARNGDELQDIHILVADPKSGKFQQDITARKGVVSQNEKERKIVLALTDATFTTIQPPGEGEKEGKAKGEAKAEEELAKQTDVERIATKRLTFPIAYGTKLDNRNLSVKTKRMGMKELLAHIQIEAEQGRPVFQYYLSLNQRLAMALSPIAFLLVGLPFAIRGKRSETSVGLLLSLLLGFGFYVFLVLTDALKDQPQLHPEILVWVPAILYQVGGILALRHVERH